MAEKYVRKCSTSLASEKCKSKQPLDSTSHQSDWPRSKTQMTTDAGEVSEIEEHFSTVGGVAN